MTGLFSLSAALFVLRLRNDLCDLGRKAQRSSSSVNRDVAAEAAKGEARTVVEEDEALQAAPEALEEDVDEAQDQVDAPVDVSL